MLAKVLGGAAAISAIAALLFWGLWNSEKVKTEQLLSKLELSISNTEILKTELSDSNDQITSLITLQSKNMDMLNDQQDKIDNIDQERNTALAENRTMRANEAYKALQQPFQRGNAASGRVTHLMRGIAGRGQGPGDKNTDGTETNNPE